MAQLPGSDQVGARGRGVHTSGPRGVGRSDALVGYCREDGLPEASGMAPGYDEVCGRGRSGAVLRGPASGVSCARRTTARSLLRYSFGLRLAPGVKWGRPGPRVATDRSSSRRRSR
jgi:hypothetical protein